MKRLAVGIFVFVTLAAQRLNAGITIDYPVDESIFPPEITAPTFIWHDSDAAASAWTIQVKFADGTRPIEVTSAGEPIRIGRIDERCISPTNEVPRLTGEQASAHTWIPEPAVWDVIKKHSVKRPAVISISGAQVRVRTSKGAVGAPIFYRDVPLMPSEVQKGVIKPLAQSAIPLIAWRLRNIAEPESRVLMEGLHTCANCHSFSRDGRTMGMDVDGPQNDKGLYALVPVNRKISIGNDNVIKWSSFRGKLGGQLRVGFMPQVSPDGQYVVTTINDPGAPDRRRLGDMEGNYYVSNFKDYRFLQVFYPTRGILAWYSRETGHLQPIPGADDPRFVHANATWSPDGKYLIFARAEAREAYPKGGKLAEFANDPNETSIQYDLYRIPFNGGKGGKAEPVAGASYNGMSNTFPKISPDGKWVVFVQCRNAQLMRPDSQLYIVPVKGGRARRMKCNTRLMNSWHSFSPNGRWLVFSSKSRSPYTQMFLTHIDKNGNDSPAILIENSTAANRAVNIPEFVKVGNSEIESMDAPATEFYRLFDIASESHKNKDWAAAIPQWEQALAQGPDDARVYYNLGLALAETGRTEEAIARFRKALELDPESGQAHGELGVALANSGKMQDAIQEFEAALKLGATDVTFLSNLGGALAETGRVAEAIPYYEKALQMKPDYADAHNNLAIALIRSGRIDEAIPHFEQALAGRPDSIWMNYNLGRALFSAGRFAEAIPRIEKASGSGEPAVLDMLAAAYAGAGRAANAVETARRALALALQKNDRELAAAINGRLANYQQALSHGE